MQVKLDVAGHVGAEPVAAHAAPLQLPFPPQEAPGVNLNFRTLGNHPDYRGGAAGPQHLVALLRRLFQPDGLEGVVHSVVRQVPDSLHHVAAGSVNDIGGAKLPGHGQLGFHRVHGDDAQGAGQGRSLDAVQAHAAAAHDAHRAARLHLRRVQHRAEAGGGAAPDEGQAVHGHVVPHLDAGVLVDQHRLSVGAKLRHLSYAFPVLSQTRRLVGTAHYVGAGAQDGLPPQAELAMAAENGQAHNHRVSRLQVKDLVAHRFYRTGGFVAQDGRLGDVVTAFNVVQVAVADAAGPGANQHLPRARGIHLHLFHLQGHIHFTQNGCFHSRTSD